jgi:hypothetical protein
MCTCLEKKKALYQLAQQERHAEARLREQVLVFFLCDVCCVLFVVAIVVVAVRMKRWGGNGESGA